MQFLRTLFWLVIAAVAAIFASKNWVATTVNLWGGLQADIKLPVLIYGAFLLGLLPALAWARATRWRLQRRIDANERALGDLRAAPADAAAEPFAPPATVAAAPAATLEPPAHS